MEFTCSPPSKRKKTSLSFHSVWIACKNCLIVSVVVHSPQFQVVLHLVLESWPVSSDTDGHTRTAVFCRQVGSHTVHVVLLTLQNRNTDLNCTGGLFPNYLRFCATC